MSGSPLDVFGPLNKVLVERTAQDAKWGEQNHPLAHWMLILGEEVGEANKAVLELAVLWRDTPSAVTGKDVDRVRDELVQVAAVAVAILEYMDRAEAADHGFFVCGEEGS
jgi:hypothetical protein